MASSSPSEALLPCFLPYERQRDARLAENRKRMEALGLLDLSHSLSISARRTPKKISKPSARLPTPPVVAAPSRRSSRLQGTTQPCYREVDRESDVNARAVTTDSRQCQPEVYSEEDEKLLGHCNEDWELFKDGFAADGTRIYDSINGKTCHQCRQKTLGLRTWCNKCESLRGQFCGDCLFMRYGENVLETNKNKDWLCPGCRGICNCSCCRIKKGWAPTGSMYRLALSSNFKSVAHYLIMTRRGPKPKTEIETGNNAHVLEDKQPIRTSMVQAGIEVPDFNKKISMERTGAEGGTAEGFENNASDEFARRCLTYNSSTLKADSQSKEELVVDISDTECDNGQQKANKDHNIRDRLRKRPRV